MEDYACVERSLDAFRYRECRRCRTGGGEVSMMAPDYADGEQVAVTLGEGQLEPEFLPQNWLRGTRAMRQSALELVLHRGLDIFASLTLLLLTLPLMLVVALAIKLDSRGPVFYRQERVGRHNCSFRILKFRSMTVDAEKPGAAVWAAVGDSRVTRVGRFIRLTRIDEIPQAINILRGDMAFVGPRPERPVFVAQLCAAIPHYAERAAVRPGLTGWAQVKYSYGASIEDARNKLSYDLWYIQERSLWLDLRIILATVRVVLRQAGAR
jgi:exopolysaccharide biosynthesis polyprenyl glycosylphosphotransferase